MFFFLLLGSVAAKELLVNFVFHLEDKTEAQGEHIVFVLLDRDKI